MIIQKHINDPTDPILIYVLKNKEKLAVNLADTNTFSALQKHYANSISRLYYSEGEFSVKTEAAILKEVKAAKLPKAKALSLQTKLMGAAKRADWKSFVSVIDEVVNNDYDLVLFFCRFLIWGFTRLAPGLHQAPIRAYPYFARPTPVECSGCALGMAPLVTKS